MAETFVDKSVIPEENLIYVWYNQLRRVVKNGILHKIDCPLNAWSALSIPSWSSVVRKVLQLQQQFLTLHSTRMKWNVIVVTKLWWKQMLQEVTHCIMQAKATTLVFILIYLLNVIFAKSSWYSHSKDMCKILFQNIPKIMRAQQKRSDAYFIESRFWVVWNISPVACWVMG